MCLCVCVFGGGGGGALDVSLEIWRRIILLVHLMFQLYFLGNT